MDEPITLVSPANGESRSKPRLGLYPYILPTCLLYAVALAACFAAIPLPGSLARVILLLPALGLCCWTVWGGPTTPANLGLGLTATLISIDNGLAILAVGAVLLAFLGSEVLTRERELARGPAPARLAAPGPALLAPIALAALAAAVVLVASLFPGRQFGIVAAIVVGIGLSIAAGVRRPQVEAPLPPPPA